MFELNSSWIFLGFNVLLMASFLNYFLKIRFIIFSFVWPNAPGQREQHELRSELGKGI